MPLADCPKCGKSVLTTIVPGYVVDNISKILQIIMSDISEEDKNVDLEILACPFCFNFLQRVYKPEGYEFEEKVSVPEIFEECDFEF